MRIPRKKKIAMDKNKAGGYSIPIKKAMLSARSCQMDATRIVPLTRSQRIECSIFNFLVRIRFRTNRNRDKLKKMIISFALSGMARNQLLIAK